MHFPLLSLLLLVWSPDPAVANERGYKMENLRGVSQAKVEGHGHNVEATYNATFPLLENSFSPMEEKINAAIMNLAETWRCDIADSAETNHFHRTRGEVLAFNHRFFSFAAHESFHCYGKSKRSQAYIFDMSTGKLLDLDKDLSQVHADPAHIPVRNKLATLVLREMRKLPPDQCTRGTPAEDEADALFSVQLGEFGLRETALVVYVARNEIQINKDIDCAPFPVELPILEIKPLLRAGSVVHGWL